MTFHQVQTGYGSTRFNDMFGVAGGPELFFITNSTIALQAADAVVAAALASGVDVNPESAIPGGFAVVYDWNDTVFSYVHGYTTNGGYTAGPVEDQQRNQLLVDPPSYGIVSFATFLIANHVDEPHTLALLGLGFAGLAFTRRRTR